MWDFFWFNNSRSSDNWYNFHSHNSCFDASFIFFTSLFISDTNCGSVMATLQVLSFLYPNHSFYSNWHDYVINYTLGKGNQSRNPDFKKKMLLYWDKYVKLENLSFIQTFEEPEMQKTVSSCLESPAWCLYCLLSPLCPVILDYRNSLSWLLLTFLNFWLFFFSECLFFKCKRLVCLVVYLHHQVQHYLL